MSLRPLPDARVVELVRRHGWNATAFQTLESGYSYYFWGEDACVAYVDTGKAWVAAGAPLASAAVLSDVARSFVAEARSAKRRACFFATEERLHRLTRGAFARVRLGEQPVWDPKNWSAIALEHASLRRQLRRAQHKGVRIRMLDPNELRSSRTRSAMLRVAERWLATRNMAPLEFLVRLEPFTSPEDRRTFLAERDGELLGFAAVVPVPARRGWFIEDLVRDPNAPNGTTELLVDAAMRRAAHEGSSFFTLGLAPLAGPLAPALEVARRSTAFLYDFDGVRSYKAKLRPESWSPIYLSYPAGQTALVSLFDALTAFTSDGLLRFGWRSLMRRSDLPLSRPLRPCRNDA